MALSTSYPVASSASFGCASVNTYIGESGLGFPFFIASTIPWNASSGQSPPSDAVNASIASTNCDL